MPAFSRISTCSDSLRTHAVGDRAARVRGAAASAQAGAPSLGAPPVPAAAAAAAPLARDESLEHCSDKRLQEHSWTRLSTRRVATPPATGTAFRSQAPNPGRCPLL